MEWSGKNGSIKFYDKTVEQNIELDHKITFIVLDQLAVIKGWNDASDSGVYSNEVKDVTKEPFIVKAFKGGLIAQGFYKDIRDKVIANGGHFTASLYVAIKIDNILQIANLQLKGAALNSWIEFVKKNRNEIYKKAVTITGVEDGKKGSVVFKTPIFAVKDVSDDTNNIANALDQELQSFLKGYFAKNTTEQVMVEEPKQEIPPPPTKEPVITSEQPDDLPF
jgi:hypothetical protein